ncbi:hypothetical protein BH09ACT7_BH09ACT7_36730 [soil metagenome]
MRNRRSAKLLAAIAGGGALIVMGAFTALAGGQSAVSPVTTAAGPMTLGATVTETPVGVEAPATTLATPVAKPAVKAKAYT